MVLNRNRVSFHQFQLFLKDVRSELNENHKEYEAFIFVFAGHGHDESLILSDGNEYGRVDLYNYFNGEDGNCPEFGNKPKLLLLEACKVPGDDDDIKSKRAHHSGPVQSKRHPDTNIAVL